MYTLTQKMEQFQINYPLEKITSLENFLFVDIETTGFTAKSSSLYMIGIAFYSQGGWYITQYFAETPSQEIELLQAFSEKIKEYSHLVHFNGNNFDLPYLMQKCQQHDISCDLDSLCGIDIYKRIAPYKFFLKLPNCKQKTIESFLEINRIDTFNGGELIGIYKDYVNEPTDFARTILMQHNFDDMKGMLEILPILAYSDIFDGKITAKKVQANHYTDFSGNSRKELLMTLNLPSNLPKAISIAANDCYFRGEGNTATLKVPIYEEELKYYYANFKDYYYLPTEDVALHKSVAGFVDREHRIPATAATCYTRKFSCYLPQWNILVEPFFKRDYKSKHLYFELTDEIKRDRETFHKYACHIVDMIASSY
ncbi:MAG: ribonuclease H-like domain-containing protein [Lachnospiraceae bacterium]|nr:ribonuclease H-like domain-containing protein [Lachnospiraceae bacterium]